VLHAANSPRASVGSTLAAELAPVAERELPDRAVCPKCHQSNTVKATQTLATEIHFCIDCSQTFAVKKPLVTDPSSS
jgi:ribosomal protein L37AE/L43A